MGSFDVAAIKARMEVLPLDTVFKHDNEKLPFLSSSAVDVETNRSQKRLDIKTRDGHYPVIVGQAILPQIGRNMVDMLGYDPSRQKVIILTDEKVAPHYASVVEESLQKAGFSTHCVIRPAGEEEKRLEVVEDVVSSMIRYGLDRSSILVALGGGVIGDLGGFVAATYMRGIDFIQVPTTVLAHDSSVGGKVAVNHPLGKNMIGAFYPPRAVFYDVFTFKTLPSREVCAGYAELIKHALISGEQFYSEFIAHIEVLVRLCEKRSEAADWPLLTHLVARGIAVKKAIVERDERETRGEREALNLGHTVAHALELVSGYGQLLHGEAVSVGLWVETAFAVRLGLADASFLAQLEDHLSRLRLPTKLPPDVSTEALLQAMLADKKNRQSAIHFALLLAPGRVIRVGLMPEEVRMLFQEVLTW